MSTPASGQDPSPLEGPGPHDSAGDFFAGVVVFLIGAYAVFEAVRMPYFGDSGLWGAPGLTPGLLGVLLVGLSLLLIVRARRFRFSSIKFSFDQPMQRAALTFGIIVAYVVALPLIGYVAATFVMMLVFQTVFSHRRDWRFILVWAVGLSVVLTAVLYWLFAKVFQIPLP